MGVYHKKRIPKALARSRTAGKIQRSWSTSRASPLCKPRAGKDHPVHGKGFQSEIMEKIDGFQGMICVQAGKRGVGYDVQAGAYCIFDSAAGFLE